jgi:hypothetical protein
MTRCAPPSSRSLPAAPVAVRRLLSFPLGLLLGLAAACDPSGDGRRAGSGDAAGAPGPAGGASGSAGAGGSGDAPGAAIADFTAAFCAAARTCCAPVPGAAGLLADCETTLSSTSPRYAALLAGRIVPDPVALSTCAAALQTAGTTCLVPDACHDLWKGTRGEGESCSPTLQAMDCRSDTGDTLCYRAAGAPAPQTFTGVCQPAERGSVGTPCVASCGPGIACSQALYTSPSSPMAICYTQDGLYCESAACAPIVPAGQPCAADPQCGTESYCAATCTPRKGAGEPCLHDDECSQIHHLYCVNDACSAASLASDAVCAGDLF